MTATNVTAARVSLGVELAAWLHAVIAGGPGFPHPGLVTDGSAGGTEAEWEGTDRFTLSALCAAANLHPEPCHAQQASLLNAYLGLGVRAMEAAA